MTIYPIRIQKKHRLRCFLIAIFLLRSNDVFVFFRYSALSVLSTCFAYMTLSPMILISFGAPSRVSSGR